jgi:dTDP-4-dehydrorhamnose 3,5-epimerase
MSKNTQVNELLIRLTHVLVDAQLWQSSPIEVEKLLSTEPFCCDTLQFEQWLQFVFIPKLQQLVDGGLPLPTEVSIAPMAEIYFSKHACFCALHNVLVELDTTLSES